MSNLTIVTFATKITSKWNMFRLLHGYRSLNKYIYCVWKPLQRYAAGAARFRQVNALYAAHLSSISIGLRSRAILVWLPQAWSAESISWYGGRLGAARIQKGNQFSTFHRIPVHSSLNSGSKEMRLFFNNFESMASSRACRSPCPALSHYCLLLSTPCRWLGRHLQFCHCSVCCRSLWFSIFSIAVPIISHIWLFFGYIPDSL